MKQNILSEIQTLITGRESIIRPARYILKIEEHNQIPPYKISEEDLVTTKCLRQLETLPKPDYKLWAHQTNYTITMLTNSQT